MKFNIISDRGTSFLVTTPALVFLLGGMLLALLFWRQYLQAKA